MNERNGRWERYCLGFKVNNIIGIKDLTFFIKFLSASYFIPGGFEQV